jgi:hypothetical protein
MSLIVSRNPSWVDMNAARIVVSLSLGLPGRFIGRGAVAARQPI